MTGQPFEVTERALSDLVAMVVVFRAQLLKRGVPDRGMARAAWPTGTAG